jgi:alpha-L-rhamnosidase
LKTRLLAAWLIVWGVILQAAEVTNLRCEYLLDPMGVDAYAPRLSWMIVSSNRGDFQRAFQILVSSTPGLLEKDNGDIWNSGRMESDLSIQVAYKGKPLQSRATYYWKVRVWDAIGNPSGWSKPAKWSMGLCSSHDWSDAKWIAYKSGELWKKEWKNHKDAELNNLVPPAWPNTSWPWLTGKDSSIFTLYAMPDPKYDPSPLFRKEFQVKKKVKSATLFVCGLGYCEVFLNGKKVGDHVLDPAWTNFEQRAYYVTYDVTGLLREGKNTAGIMLGRGQYDPLCNDIWGLSKAAWVDQPKVIALLYTVFTDGSTTEVVTDGDWKTSGGPVVYDDTRHGELYDARLEQAGWSSPGFNESQWKHASEVEWNAILESQMMPPVRCFAPVVPVKTYPKGEGVMVYDIGKNIAGWARVKVRGPSGARVLVEYCETPSDSVLLPWLTPSRFQYHVRDKKYASFYDKYVNVRQQNGYILKGKGAESFECHFSYKGFQFVRVTADKGVTIDRVEGIPVHTDVEAAGEFICSNRVVNQTQQNAVLSMLNNYHSIATDCPHREKQGWTADNYISAQAAMYNFNMTAFYEKWLTDLAGTQSPQGGLGTVAPATNYDMDASTVWPAAIVFIPWDLYGFYADTLPMRKNLEVMHRFALSSLHRQVEGKPGIINDVLGDWLAPLMVMRDSSRNNTMAPPEGFTLYGTASHYLIVKRLSEINAILGRDKEAQETKDWARRIAADFNREFLEERTSVYHGDKPTEYRQSANIVPLRYGLVPEDKQKAVLDHLIRDLHDKGDRLSTGFLGTAALMDYLPDADPELAYKIATQKRYPGWGYMIDQGANAMWESWDGYDSRNHTPFCLISAYFYKYLAGIQPDFSSPGFKHILINPSIVGDLTFVSAWYDAPYGRIVSNWKRENGKLSMEVSIPANTTATVYVTTRSADSVLESGRAVSSVKEITFVGVENGKAVYNLGSGNYHFVSEL